MFSSATVIMVALVAGWWFWQSRSVKLTSFSNNLGVSFNYPQKLDVQPLSEQDNKDKFLFRALQPQGILSLLITLRYEEGLKRVISLSKQEPIDLLVNNTKLAYPKRFPGYKEISQRMFDIKGHKAAEFIFTYQNKGETVKQQFLIIIKDDDTAFYLAFQSKESDFDKVSNKYFTLIINSLDVK